MAVTGTEGRQRAYSLLNGIPERFNEFCHMDQMTFVDLADWLAQHGNRRDHIPQAISVEECLFVFLDIIVQQNSFRTASYNWGHDVQMTKSIFTNVLEELQRLCDTETWSPDCPPWSKSRKRWSMFRGSRAGRCRMDGKIKVGEDWEYGDGMEINQENLISALTAINNRIFEFHEFYS